MHCLPEVRGLPVLFCLVVAIHSRCCYISAKSHNTTQLPAPTGSGPAVTRTGSNWSINE